MNIQDLTKNIFVDFLSAVKDNLYKAVLDGNNDILRIFPELNSDSPLWMVTGGEAINYYSADSDKTPTKDIDCKLLFVGQYNIPKELFKHSNLPIEVAELRRGINKYFPDILIDTGFNITSVHLNDLLIHINRVVLPAWSRYIHRYLPQMTCGYNSRQNIVWNCINPTMGYGHIVYVTPDNKFAPLNLHDINAHNSHLNEWRTMDLDFQDGGGARPTRFKLYLFRTPYVQAGKKTDSFPYSCNSGIITDAELYYIEQQLDVFYANSNVLWDLYYQTITLINLRRYLMSLIGACILVNERGDKIVLQEGILDLFIDFSASQSDAGKYIYENKSLNGMIPNIIKKVPYNGQIGYLKIPTLNWLIYDQTRMLYHSLRLQEVGHHNWSDVGVTGWQDFEEGKQKKYFSKLKGMLVTFLNVLNFVEDTYKKNKSAIVSDLQSCTNETECSPSFFLSHIYSQIMPTSFITDTTGRGKNIKKYHHRKITKHRKHKRPNKTRHAKRI